jgi:DNA polymerase-1
MPTETFMAVDTEARKDGTLICAQFCTEEKNQIFYYPEQKDMIQTYLNHPCDKVMHNANYDCTELTHHGFSIRGTVHDTMLLVKCFYELLASYSLKNLGYYFLGDPHIEQMKLEEWFLLNYGTRDGDMGDLPRNLLESYALKDTRITHDLFEMFYPRVKENPKLLTSYHREIDVIWPVVRMQQHGVLVDREWVKRYSKEAKQEVQALTQKCRTLTNDPTFNPNSNQQLAKILESSGSLLNRTAKGNVCLDKRARKSIDHPIIEIKNRLEELSKKTGTYCENLLAATEESCVVKPSFNISLAATRRFSSGEIFDKVDARAGKLNWQNFPEQMRHAVRVPKGYVGWFFDYKQIENVIHIFESRDEVRKQAYLSDENWSEYLWLAEQILGHSIEKTDRRYKLYKSTKLGMNYGMGVKTFSEYHGIPKEEARRLFNQIYQACPAIKKLQNSVENELSNFGCVYDPFGYVYHGTPDKAYKVVAYKIQGCAAALMKAAIVAVSKIKGVQLRLTVHDELYITTRDDAFQYTLARKIKKAMTNFSDFFGGIPIRVECYRSTTTWAEKQLVKL